MDTEIVLGLFYSDENNLIFDNIKFSENLSENSINQLKMLPYKFFGPVFLTAASGKENWEINLIESSLSLLRKRNYDADIIQTFFSLNSSKELAEDQTTHLFALVGSPHTEDVKLLYDKLVKYIHPSIIQGKLVQEKMINDEFQFKKFIKSELIRGLNLIDYSLGASRRIYWEEQQKYFCIGMIERIFENGSKSSNFYTFDKDNPLRKHVLPFIPSFYIFTILPDYYENLIDETLKTFDKTGIYPHIRRIELKSQEKQAIYMEEFKEEKDVRKSYGVILIPEGQTVKEGDSITYYKRNLRDILDGHKDLSEVLKKLNPQFKNEKWCTSTDEDLNKIRACFDDTT